ncbi:arginine/serine-rich coiled-coil protein 2 isoform X2 [Drosophila busckii]|nr:arginine/serine-rich coiled-coil protein 2 isoform X2 [Drosophila busckii]
MREMNGQDYSTSEKPQERKINPLGKPNKRFLGRTLNNVIRHNQRETERTQMNCLQKLQDLDDRYERRRSNNFYFRREFCERQEDTGSSRSRSRKRSHRKRHRKNKSSSRSRSRSPRHKSKRKRKREKKRERKRDRKHKRRGRSNSSSNEDQPTRLDTECYTNNLALSVAIAYHKATCKEPPPPPSITNDIIQELMSDSETLEKETPVDTYSIASSHEEAPQILTIDVDSSIDSASDTESSAGSCIELSDSTDEDQELTANNNSDIELVTTVDLTEEY